MKGGGEEEKMVQVSVMISEPVSLPKFSVHNWRDLGLSLENGVVLEEGCV